MSRNLAYPKNRRLKKSEIKEFISNGAKFNQELSDQTYKKYSTGYEEKDEIYDLPNGDFMYVHGKSIFGRSGKGAYWERDSLLRSLKWRKKVQEYSEKGIGSSGTHWRYYTKQGNNLFDNADLNLNILSKELQIDRNKLDFSYNSLGVIDKLVEQHGVDKAIEALYDALIFYVGCVIINRIGGEWKIETQQYGGEYPFVTIAKTNLHYMPMNIVWGELDGHAPCNMRKATADEIKTLAIWHPKNNVPR